MRDDAMMSRTEWLLLWLLSILWGGSFFFSKVAVGGLLPLTIVFVRFSAAAILVYAYLRARHEVVPNGSGAWASFAVMGLLNNLIPAGLIVWGQRLIPSGLAAVLIATTPIFSLLAVRSMGGGARITPGKMLGIALGLAGTAVLLGVGDPSGPAPSVVGAAACLGAAVSYGFANAFGRRFQRLGIAPAVGAFGQMAATSVMALPLMLMLDRPWRLAAPDTEVCAAMAGLVVLSTALGYIIFFRILSGAGAVNVSLVTLLIPVTAVLLGGLVLGERLSLVEFAGMSLIGLGLVAVDGRAWGRVTRGRSIARPH